MSEAKNVFLTFANDTFMQGGMKYQEVAKEVGFDQSILYTRGRLESTDFFAQNRKILEEKKGSGYWLWKPFIISQTLSELSEDDVLIYNDCGKTDQLFFFDRLPRCLIGLSRESEYGVIGGFSTHWFHQSRFTKRDCFLKMEQDTVEMRKAPQIAASWSVWRNTAKAREFLEEWLHYGCMPECITDDANVLGMDDYPDFQENRHDQTIFSILVHKHRIPHFNLAGRFVRGQRKIDREKYGNSPHYPKRAGIINRIMESYLEDTGRDPDREGYMGCLGEFLEYTDPNTPIVQLKIPDGTVPRAVRIQQARDYAANSPDLLEFQHVRARWTFKELLVWQEHYKAKRPEYQEFLKAKLVDAVREGAPDNQGRVPVDEFFENYLDLTLYEGDLTDIDDIRTMSPERRREHLNKVVDEFPDRVDWSVLQSCLTVEERAELKQATKGLKKNKLYLFRDYLVNWVAKHGVRDLNFKEIFDEWSGEAAAVQE